MLKINSPIVRETLVTDPETNKSIVIRLDPPGLMIGLRTKQAKQTYMISILDVWMAARHAMGEDFRAVIPKPKMHKAAEPRPSEVIKDVLSHNDRMHPSQIRQQLKEKGIEISKSLVWDILGMLKAQKEVDQDDRMHYFLTHKAQ